MTKGSADDVQAFFARHARAYADSHTHKYGKDLQRLLELVPFQPEHRLLDVATGPGHVAFAVAPLVREVIGLDFTPEMGDHFQLEAQQRGIKNAAFVLGDVHHLPFQAQDLPSRHVPPRSPPFQRCGESGTGDDTRACAGRVPYDHRYDPA